jgi:hypothetical protein
MVVVFSVWSQTMSRLLHKGEGFGGEEQGRARDRPGKRKCAEVCGFCEEEVGRELSLLI